MGSNDSKPKASAPPPVRPIEVKTYVMSCQAKMSLYRNKKVYEIKKKKDEIVAALKQNNLDIAKAKMESIIRLEDTITVYDILGPLCEILKERITYLMEAQEVPPDIKAQLDTIIYASSRVDIDDLYKLRDLVQRKYGSYYIQAADQNKDGLVNINVIEKLKIRPPVDAFLTIRLKQLCKEKKIKFEFPEEIAPSFDDGMGMNNNFNQQNPYAVGDGNNPYAPMNNNMGMGNNPYAPMNNNMGMGNNPYAAPMNDNNMGMGNNPYGPGYGPGNDNLGNPFSGGNNNNMGPPGPGVGDFDSYMKSGGNNMGGPGQGGNPYDNNPNNNMGNMGNNPFNAGNNENPYGDNQLSNNSQGGNPYATGDNSGGNPFSGGDNSGGNPYAAGDSGGNPYA